MNKCVFAAAAAMMICAGAMAEKVTIYKGGVAVAEFELAENDSVVFSPASAAESLAAAVAGKYEAKREVTIPVMPDMGVLVSDEVVLNVTAVGADSVEVVLPSCQYSMGGSEFDLPSASVRCEVTKTDAGYTLEGKFEGKLTDKDTKIDLTATIGADGTFSFTQDMTYGQMPMPLHMAYTNKSAE